MADATYAYHPRPGFLARLGEKLMRAREHSLNCQGRVEEIARLKAMDDTALAARGLRREDITAHVFRDLYYL